jgi:hypothetical protein
LTMTWQQLIEWVAVRGRSKAAREWADGTADLEDNQLPKTMKEWKASLAEAFDAGGKWAKREPPEEPRMGH